MTAVSHATFMDLPRDVLRIVLRHVPRGWHGVLKHVNRQLRDTVRAVEEEESRVNQIDMTVVCSSRHTVEWAVRQRCPWDSRTACAIAETGDCELLQWAQDGVPHQPHDLNWDCNVWVSASISGNLEMLQYIKTEDLASREDALDEAVEEAAARGQLCVLQWMNEEFSKPDDEWTSAAMYVAAAESGHVPVLQWMKEQQIPLHEPCKMVCLRRGRPGRPPTRRKVGQGGACFSLELQTGGAVRAAGLGREGRGRGFRGPSGYPELPILRVALPLRDMRGGGLWGTPRRPAVGSSQRGPVGRVDDCQGCSGRALPGTGVGSLQWGSAYREGGMAGGPKGQH